ncbi:MAG: glyoxalase [Rhodobacterales bacterium 32-66-7]|nr:MAG: glyoxalase [Rhodobacterales bacterium 32-66-7]
MDYDTVPAAEFGHALRQITINLLCRDVPGEAAFLVAVFSMTLHRASRDFAILLHAGQPMQLHSDAAYASHPLPALLPEASPRGAGIEIRLHEADPDQAALRAEAAGGVVLQHPTDKTAHGLREAVILSPSGYAFVPSRRI